ARIALADIYMNTFGQPLAAMDWVKPISDSIEHAEDAALTTLMAGLYDRDTSAEHHNQQILAFAKRALQMDTNAFWQGLGRPVPQHTAWPMPSDAKWRPRSGRQRPRVALMSPMLSVTPVYFLTIAGWRHIAKGCDLVVFNRGHLNDWATQAFRQLAVEWHDVQELNAQQLATQLVHADLDVLYDMGGWSDPVGLKALSVKPVLQMFKWVGGQSVTTGLTCFDGWIGDPWQSPLTLQHLFTEPLINIAQGYAVYTPPDYLPSPPRLKRDMPVVFANPAKLSRAFLRELQAIPGKKCLLHKQFKFAPARAQVLKFLPEHDVEFVTPNSHREALEVLGQHKIMLDTFPYSSGLTAHEANAMGVKVKARAGTLFCERHSARLIDGLIS
ncbi:MAG: hypothetical protein EBT70_16395, partial [Betaproteobacteria bacterium]|nr:hypothetical protein [Betaproteobacteria bacterium]